MIIRHIYAIRTKKISFPTENCVRLALNIPIGGIKTFKKGKQMKLKFLLVGIISSLLSFQFIAEEEVEEVVVTGSYIKSSPTDGASPVEIVDR